jgi:chaperonin cofactor prefoldin
MKKGEMLLRLERLLQILVSRKNYLQAELEAIDNLPLNKVNKENTNRWHTIFCKIKHLENRIETIKTEMEILAGKRDKVRDIISESKSIFNSIFSANLGVK